MGFKHLSYRLHQPFGPQRSMVCRGGLIVLAIVTLANAWQIFSLNLASESEHFQQTMKKQDQKKEPQKLRSRRSFLLATALAPSLLTVVPPSSPAFAADSRPLSSRSSSSTVLQESRAGSAAGIALTLAKTIVKYPLDTATVRLQKPDSSYKWIDLFSYRGVTVPLLSNIPSAAIFFAVKDASRLVLRDQTELPQWLITCLAVAIAQLPYWIVRNPSEVVKTRQQAQMKGYANENSTAWDSFKMVGADAIMAGRTPLSGYYTGYWENLAYAYPADVLKFVVYEQLAGGGKKLSPMEGAVVGATATAVAQLLTTPLDVVRNRFMMQWSSNTSTLSLNEKDTSYSDLLIDLAKTEGLSGLFAGAAPRVGKAVVSGAIQFATYEQAKRQFGRSGG